MRLLDCDFMDFIGSIIFGIFYPSVFLTSLVPHPRTLCADIVAADVVVVVVVVVTVDVDGADVGALPSLGPSPSWTSLSCA